MEFGRLKVLERASNDKQGRAMWLCQCSCKNRNKVIVSGYNLRNKKNPTQSCGCLNREKIFNTLKKYNKYDLSGEFGIGWTINTNQTFLFDLEDYEKIKYFCWRESNDGYIVALDNLLLHRLVMNVLNNPNVEIDHIQHNKNDNRKEKMRIVNTTQNMMNKSLMSNNLSSGITGVTWNKKKNKWQAYISFYGKTLRLGLFDNIEDAMRVRKNAEDKYFKEYSYDKSMKLR